MTRVKEGHLISLNSQFGFLRMQDRDEPQCVKYNDKYQLDFMHLKFIFIYISMADLRRSTGMGRTEE
jgi:hypothetical protein